jgi:lipoate---protein ligase
VGALPPTGTHRLKPLPWRLEQARASAFELHAWTPPAETRVVRVNEVARRAVVLGSTQPDTADRGALEHLGADVARRRSGGAAVWVEPDDPLWIDVVVPRGDPLWDDDVGRSFLWLGRCWAETLARCGVAGAQVHEGALVKTALSPVVCFAGVGPGEVVAGGRKVVGIAQRRTRHAAWFQCAVPGRWDPQPLAAVFGLDPVALAGLASGVAAPPDQLRGTFLDVLSSIS